MSKASRFLTAVAQAISTMTLYDEGHPARERASAAAHDRLQELQETLLSCRFAFLGDDIILDNRPLRELRAWDWGSRFARAGIQWLEITGPVDRGDLDFFLEAAYQRLAGLPADSAEARPGRPTHVRWGAAVVRSGETDVRAGRLITATLAFNLRDEMSAVQWIQDELKDGKKLQLLEAECVIRSLSIAMHGDQAFMIPLLRIKRFDQYTTTHALNVSVLAMSLGEFIGLTPADVRTFGIAGMLHDMGKVVVPADILNKPGKLTAEERLVMNRHPAEGARIILQTEQQLELAATVAYEHHIKLNGEGYPALTYPRRCHQSSDLIHVCDVFDALRTNRPDRDAWPTEQVVSYIEQGAGTEFDPVLARAFTKMMRTWEQRIHDVEDPAAPLPLGGPDDVEAGPDVLPPPGAPPETDTDDDDMSWS